MTDNSRAPEPEPSLQRERAISRWDKEGGAGFGGPQNGGSSAEVAADAPELTNAELVQLRVRVIALENLVIALLAGASDRQLDLAHEMATYISPRPGFTQHSLTVHAAAHMVDLAQRANQFRDPPPSPSPYRQTAIFDETFVAGGASS